MSDGSNSYIIRVGNASDHLAWCGSWRGVVSSVVLFENRSTASVLLVQFTLHTLAEWRDENPEPYHPCHVEVTETHSTCCRNY